MSSKKMNGTTRQQEQFTGNCLYLGLKDLAWDYPKIIDRAGNDSPGYYEFLRDIIQREALAKNQRHIDYLIRCSRLPSPMKLLADFDFDFQAGLSRRLIMDLASLGFIERHESILFIGDNGTGKSHLAQSLSLLACHGGYRTYYTTCSELIADLNTGVYEKSLEKRMRKYINPELLLIDEMGHDRLELQVVREAHLLFKVIDVRYKQNKSLIFTSNIEEEEWAEFLGDPISTSAILDRIFHHSVIVKINGPSYRKYQSGLLQKEYADNKPPEEDKVE